MQNVQKSGEIKIRSKTTDQKTFRLAAVDILVSIVQAKTVLEFGVLVGVLVLNRLRRGSALSSTKLEMIGYGSKQGLNTAVRVHLVREKRGLLTEHLLQERLLARLQTAGDAVLHNLATIHLIAGLAAEAFWIVLEIAASA